jgi:hypothetical protein
MPWFIIEVSGLAAVLAAILWLQYRLSLARRRRARKQATIGTAILAAMLGLGWACELDAGGVDSHQRGNWYSFDSGQPGAFLALDFGATFGAGTVGAERRASARKVLTRAYPR